MYARLPGHQVTHRDERFIQNAPIQLNTVRHVVIWLDPGLLVKLTSRQAGAFSNVRDSFESSICRAALKSAHGHRYESHTRSGGAPVRRTTVSKKKKKIRTPRVHAHYFLCQARAGGIKVRAARRVPRSLRRA